ncbi:ribonuclease E/G [Murimonas intestini]|nr:ribonuclease E/G [Murimonas intestini]MCR1864158.1 ribonuclease E/G [Murimonas intestini]MCR1881768.1 ribonuclease E/G [Murimonas intestini]
MLTQVQKGAGILSLWKNWGMKLAENTVTEKLLITKLEGNIVTALMRGGQVIEFRCEPVKDNRLLGNIYVGRVRDVVKNIQAAFIEIGKGMPCYYSLDENKTPLYTKKSAAKTLAQGDELLVQVSRESSKSKAPSVSSCLNFTGKYLVLTSGNTRVGFSQKLTPLEKKRLREWIEPYRNEQYGIVVRTNARNAGQAELEQELEALLGEYRRVTETAPHRTCFSLVYETPRDYLTALRDTYTSGLESIVTDDRELYASVKEYLSVHQPGDLPLLKFYEDGLLPLNKLYSLEKSLKEALAQKVWLKSGAYLVIQPTEALTVIDVNTGKCTQGKYQQETFLKINLEACREIARQLRLRNVSGIIIVDFINMEEKDYQGQLLKEFERFLKQDPVKSTLVDITPLGLVEVTRKKVRKPLSEQFSQSHSATI